MGTKKIRQESTCPIARTASIVGDTWILLIIRDLLSGSKRFSELEALLESISTRTLTKKLHFLEAEGIVSRQEFHESPPRVDYALTKEGKALKPIVEALFNYGKKHLQQ